MTESPKAKPPVKIETTVNQVGDNVCGIVMPIAPMSDDYSAAHWERVKKILEKAVTDAGFSPKVVWDNPAVAVIQSKILKNIYENEIIICDLSNLNPNVMLEAGLRLSTKKPTILVTDQEKKPPFDVCSIEYIPYPKNLEYNEIDLFIKNLSERICEVSKAYRSKTYKSFVDSYQFEIAKPSTIEISAEQYITKQMDDLKSLFINNMTTKNITPDKEDFNKIYNNKANIIRFKSEFSVDYLFRLIDSSGLDPYLESIKTKNGKEGVNYYVITLTCEAHYGIYKKFESILKNNGARIL